MDIKTGIRVCKEEIAMSNIMRRYDESSSSQSFEDRLSVNVSTNNKTNEQENKNMKGG
jgi:hypothetical protein|tara:strand:+ start:718 stop:891 length:174 start_codon:yes stop_codon:yes gene_type:complete